MNPRYKVSFILNLDLNEIDAAEEIYASFLKLELKKLCGI